MELSIKMFKAIETFTQKFVRMDFIFNIIFGFLLIIIISLLSFIGYIVFETEIYKDDFKIKKGDINDKI